MMADSEWLREHLNAKEDDGPLRDRIRELAAERAGLETTGGPDCKLPEEFMVGLVGALFDVWDLVQRASEVEEM